MGLLTAQHTAWIGHEDPAIHVEITRRDIQKYSAATEQQQARYLKGDEAPPMFVFNLFSAIPQLADLRQDGLARSTTGGPSLPLKRTMAGGTEVRQHRPIRPGDVLTGTRKIVDMFEKQGASGPLIFTVRSLRVVDAADRLVLEEIQTGISR
ncbi:MAG: MaoC family dehydratase N-terminal domain-containing protein [Pseudomonadota bacterium]